MTTFYEIPITNAARQRFITTLNGRSCQFDVNFNVTTQRWSFDLEIEGTLVLAGRRIVLGVDLLEPFKLGLGQIFAVAWTPGALPDREGLPSGAVRLINAVD
ncbi:hypothetical protein ABLE91_05835 [Aquabacter sp. CN5-332]|uniref:phage baseplate plug family protein n=1 Tax=Aquabacter sp. CN5-332 TaxID=3156608 RepID=UPI0032B35085